MYKESIYQPVLEEIYNCEKLYSNKRVDSRSRKTDIFVRDHPKSDLKPLSLRCYSKLIWTDNNDSTQIVRQFTNETNKTPKLNQLTKTVTKDLCELLTKDQIINKYKNEGYKSFEISPNYFPSVFCNDLLKIQHHQRLISGDTKLKINSDAYFLDLEKNIASRKEIADTTRAMHLAKEEKRRESKIVYEDNKYDNKKRTFDEEYLHLPELYFEEKRKQEILRDELYESSRYSKPHSCEFCENFYKDLLDSTSESESIDIETLYKSQAKFIRRKLFDKQKLFTMTEEYPSSETRSRLTASHIQNAPEQMKPTEVVHTKCCRYL